MTTSKTNVDDRRDRHPAAEGSGKAPETETPTPAREAGGTEAPAPKLDPGNTSPMHVVPPSGDRTAKEPPGETTVDVGDDTLPMSVVPPDGD